MRLLVCGGRDFSDKLLVFQTLDKAHSRKPISLLIQGGAKGADRLALEWAWSRKIPVNTYAADWTLYGKAAGHIRNTWMLVDGKPDYVLAFKGGAGTANMIKQAKAAGVQTYEVKLSRT